MVKILLINVQIYSNININKQTNFEYDSWAKVKALLWVIAFDHISHLIPYGALLFI